MEEPLVAAVVTGARQQPAARGLGEGKHGFVGLKVVEKDPGDSKKAEEKGELEHAGPIVRWHMSVPLVPLRNESLFLDTMDE